MSFWCAETPIAWRAEPAKAGMEDTQPTQVTENEGALAPVEASATEETEVQPTEDATPGAEGAEGEPEAQEPDETEHRKRSAQERIQQLNDEKRAAEQRAQAAGAVLEANGWTWDDQRGAYVPPVQPPPPGTPAPGQPEADPAVAFHEALKTAAPEELTEAAQYEGQWRETVRRYGYNPDTLTNDGASAVRLRFIEDQGRMLEQDRRVRDSFLQSVETVKADPRFVESEAARTAFEGITGELARLAPPEVLQNPAVIDLVTRVAWTYGADEFTQKQAQQQVEQQASRERTLGAAQSPAPEPQRARPVITPEIRRIAEQQGFDPERYAAELERLRGENR